MGSRAYVSGIVGDHEAVWLFGDELEVRVANLAVGVDEFSQEAGIATTWHHDLVVEHRQDAGPPLECMKEWPPITV